MDIKSHDRELQEKCSRDVCTVTDPAEKFRCCVFRKYGAKGLNAIGRKFRIIDDSGDKKIDFDEFMKACNESGIKVSDATVKEMFQTVDKDNSGYIDFDEFLIAIRPPMSDFRKNLAMLAFAKMDSTGDGVITDADVKKSYNIKEHSLYQNGQMTESQVYRQFLDNFDGGVKDGKITREEWLNYFAGISASIDKDSYFDLMMRTAWKLDEPSQTKK